MNTPAPTLKQPASTRFIILSLFVALMLDLLPWQGIALLARPDFVLLMLLYWIIHQPLRVGLAAAWSLGLVMDVADGALLGQFALAYTVTAYLALMLHRRIQAFGLWQQALHVAMLLVFCQALILMTYLVTGSHFIGWRFFLASASGTLAWPVICLFIELLQQRKALPDIGYSARSGEK